MKNNQRATISTTTVLNTFFMVILSIIFGFLLSHGRIVKGAKKQLTVGPKADGKSVYTALAQRANMAYNLGKVSEKTPAIDAIYVEELYKAAEKVLNSNKTKEYFAANIELSAMIETISLEFSQLPADNANGVEAANLVADLRRLEERIQVDGEIYNTWAMEKNKELQSFPANIFMNAFQREFLELYEPTS